MVMAHVECIAINYAMSVNPFATNVVKPAQIPSWWYEEIAKINPAQRNSDPPRAYISVINELSQHLFSRQILCNRLLQRFFAPMQQWYIAAGPRSTLFMDFEPCRLH